MWSLKGNQEENKFGCLLWGGLLAMLCVVPIDNPSGSTPISGTVDPIWMMKLLR